MEMIRSGKHNFFCALFLIFVVFMLFGCGKKEPDAITPLEDIPRSVIRVGLEPYAPFDYINESGEHVGIDVDLAREAFHRIGYEPQFVNIHWEDRDELLSEGKIDCIWCCYSMRGRQTAYHWAGPYLVSHMVVAVNPSSEIQHVSDLKGKLVAVRSSTKAERLMSQEEGRRLDIEGLYTFNDRELMYTSLYKGYVDAVVSHEEAIVQYMKDNQMDFRLLPEALETTGIGVAFSRTDTRALVGDLHMTLQAMRKDGTTERILRKYVDDPTPFLKEVQDE